ncbi:MAG: hypothetical protein WBD14_04070 [Phycisphaerae bacterium]
MRTICPACKAPYEAPAPVRRRIQETLGSADGLSKGRGCAACRHTGFRGRIGLFELLLLEPPLADLVRQGADADRLRTAARDAGLPSLWVDGINKVRAGITPLDEVLEALEGCPGRPAALDPAPDRAQA